ncbi:MAG: ABC transporter substrate-binding protein [Acidobacteriia bacterium]|nr:ABC transporter substrate-binding protein [Terriglobia bacterium]
MKSSPARATTLLPAKGTLMTIRGFHLGQRFAAIFLALFVFALLPQRSHAQTELVVTDYGGSFEDGWRKSVVEPFERAHPDIKIKLVQKLVFESMALMRAQKDDVKIDVFMMDEVGAAQAAAEGLVQPISVKTVPHLAELYPAFRVPGDSFAKFMFDASVIAYNTQQVSPAPQSYKDFWNPNYSGRIAINNLDSATGLSFFLMLLKTEGATMDHTDPAFAAMKKLKPAIVTFPEQHAQLAQLFTQGDIVMAPWTSDRTLLLASKGIPIAFVIPKEGGIIQEGGLVIAKGTRKLQAAQLYVNFALSVEAQAANAKFTFLSPTNSKVVLDPQTAAKIPNGLNAIKALTHPDWKKANELRPQWIDRWNREVTQ